MGRKGSGIEVRDSCIRVTFTFRGKPRRETLKLNGMTMLPTTSNVKYAHRLVQEIRDKIRYDNFNMAEYFPDSSSGIGGELTVSSQLDAWLSGQRIEASTKAGYQAAINFWRCATCDTRGNTIGATHLRILKPSHIKTAVASRADLSGKTINNYTSVLRAAIEFAKDDSLITANPMDKVAPSKHQKESPDPFSRDEFELIAAEFSAKHPGQVANLVEFWLWTGMRTSELAGLKWNNVDLANGTVLVAEAMVRGIRKSSTKTNKARTVQLNSRALSALKAQSQITQNSGDEVFLDPRYGTPWSDERAFRRSYWTPILKSLGIRYRRPYNMRHSCATDMLMAGMNHSYCAGQLGHSVDIFQRTYSKWIDGEQNEREMDRWEATLVRTKSKKTTE